MKRDLQDLLLQATRLTQAGRLTDATEIIQRALNGRAGPPAHPRNDFGGPSPSTPRGDQTAAHSDAAADEAWVLDGCVFEIAEPAPSSTPPPAATAPPHTAQRAGAGRDEVAPAPDPCSDTFTNGQHSHAGLTRRYKLYAPPALANRGSNTLRPLVLMLHGCTQNADDFAAGTAMNELAREQGFVVLYPEQSADANTSRCWNWFKHNHQQRGRGEPALLASLTQAVMQKHAIDPRRVYVAGLSAGGAMAAILGAAYPDLFAAVGVHSGLPSGAARTLPEALAAMKGGAAAAHAVLAQPAVPTIVFHGDQDLTVHPKNGEGVIAAQVGSPAAAGAMPSLIEKGFSKQGRPYTRQLHRDANGCTVAEHWVVHGAGHAWSGGRAGASYTDASGPDASAEMLRFFLSQPGPPRGYS